MWTSSRIQPQPLDDPSQAAAPAGGLLSGRSLQLAVVAALAVTLAVSVLVPIYTDEITWKWLQARFLLDGGHNITLIPQCGAPFDMATPWFMVPLRLVQSWIYGDMWLLQLRFLGIATFAGWLVLAVALLRRAVAPPWRGLALASTVAAAAGLGSMPFLLVLNRPEQLLLIGFTLVLLAPFCLPQRRSYRLDVLLAALAVLVITVLFTEHAKSLLFFPLIAVSLFFVVRRTGPRLFAYGSLTYLAARSYGYWSERSACPDDPEYAAYLNTQILRLSELTSHPLATLKAMLLNLVDSYKYLSALKLNTNYPVAWLPKFQVPDALLHGGTALVMLVFAGTLVVLTVSLCRLAARTVTTRRLSMQLAVVAASLASLSAIAVLQGVKYFYEGALLLPLLGLTVLLAIPAGGGPRLRRAGRVFNLGLLAVSLLSQMVLWGSMASLPLAYYTAGGYLPQQKMSISGFNEAALRPQIRETARLCGIAPDARHVAVDDLTYPTLAHSVEPYNAFYVRRGRNSPLDDLPVSYTIELLTAKHAAGMVTLCAGMPPGLRAMARENGAFCCIPAFDGNTSSAAAEGGDSSAAAEGGDAPVQR